MLFSTFAGHSQPISSDPAPVNVGNSAIAIDDFALVGRWIREGARPVAWSPIPLSTLELLKDGTGFSGSGITTWRADNGRLYIFVVGAAAVGGGSTTFVYNYQISDSTLTITNDNGDSATFTRK